MNKFIILFILTLSFTINGQEGENTVSFDNIHTTYFKEKISKYLLNNITYPRNNNNLEISFYVNKESIPFNIRLNSMRNPKLNQALIKAFKLYPLENFNINFDTKKQYSFRVITKKMGKNIISCDDSLTKTTAPNCIACQDLDFYVDIQRCVNNQLKEYFYNTIDYSLVKKDEADERIFLNIRLFIDQNGFLRLRKVKAPIEFKDHIKSIVEKYTQVFTPKTVNNNSVNYNYTFARSFKAGEKPKSEKLFKNFDSIFKPSNNNKFAQYLSKNLTEKEISNANLNRVNNRLSIYFELDKKGLPIEVSTNSRSKKLEEKIISLFKNFNLNDFTFINKNHLNRYFTPVIVFKDGKNSIKTNNIMGYNRIPILTACKEVKTSKEARKCFSRQVQMYFAKKFNTNLPNKLKLNPGRKRIFIGFKINKKGKIADIKVRAPHKKIKEEVIRVMKKLPKASPAIYGNEPVDIKFSIPFTLIVN